MYNQNNLNKNGLNIQNENMIYNNCFCYKSYFRLLNAIVGGPALDVYLNEMLMASNLKYGEFSRYLQLMPGEYSVVAYPSGSQNEAIFETNIEISRNLAYTGAIAGDISDISNLSIYMIPEAKENLIMNRMAAVKFINLIPESPPLDLISGDGTILFTNIEYGETTNNVAIPAGTYTLHLRAKGSNRNLLTAPNIEFAPKMFFTLFVIGEYGATPKIEMLIPEDGLNYLDIC